MTHNSDLFRAWIIDNITSQRLIDIALRQVDVQDSNIREVFDWNFQRGCHNNKITLEDVSIIFSCIMLTLTRPIGLPFHEPVAQEITDQR